jgi:hypothetical protein
VHKLAYKVNNKKEKKDENLYTILELSVMSAKLGILDPPSFTKTGDKMKSQDENGTQDKNLKIEKKEGIKLVLAPKLVLAGVSPLVLDSLYLCAFNAPHIFWGWINSCLNKTNPTILVN